MNWSIKFKKQLPKQRVSQKSWTEVLKHISLGLEVKTYNISPT